ncbi:3-ketoacyl-CoA thiolase 2, peroxisomal [Thalictrum thalictroides]|uniref:3-ketoacyl-CoA thiolase 2, peroxisomal n=1 Tax=Thalictrum thalictroides TaxID=46969 RepID=A0A7J6VXT5_THATH|nr:3-ketoacyl-CoA thiolase 2, peroxisomal [Thalictrum thalictroides]
MFSFLQSTYVSFIGILFRQSTYTIALEFLVYQEICIVLALVVVEKVVKTLPGTNPIKIVFTSKFPTIKLRDCTLKVQARKLQGYTFPDELLAPVLKAVVEKTNVNLIEVGGIGVGLESLTVNPMAWEESINPKVQSIKEAQDCLFPMGVTSENVAQCFGV